MRPNRRWVGLLAGAFVLASPRALRAQDGFVTWQLQVDLQGETQQSGPHQKTSESYVAHIDAVVQGPPLQDGMVELGFDKDTFVRRAVTGHASKSLSSEDSSIEVSGNADPDEAKAYLRWIESEPRSHSFSASVGFPMKGTEQGRCRDTPDGPLHPCTLPITDGGGVSITANNRTPSLTITRHGTSFSIDGTVTTAIEHGFTKTTVHATVRPAEEVKYDAVLVPADRKAYEKWIPEGPPLPDGKEEDGGNSVGFFLELRDHLTHQPVNLPFSARYTLHASRLPGWCMNAPAEDQANDDPDLYFDPAKNPGHQPLQDRQILTVDKALGDDLFTVTSRDYGAYGTLEAEVTLLDDGQALRARTEDEHGQLVDDPLQIPLDRNGNHVADAWEKDPRIHVFARNLPGDWDGEDEPAGMAKQGDGYGLFEEYRGFWLDEPATVRAFANASAPDPSLLVASLIRLDPNKRELLVRLDGSRPNLFARGALLFEQATGIRIYVVPSNRYAGATGGDLDSAHHRRADFDAHRGGRPDFTQGHEVVFIKEAKFNGPGLTPPKGISDMEFSKKQRRYLAPYMGPDETQGAWINLADTRKMILAYAGDLEKGTNPVIEEGLKTLELAHQHVERRAAAAWARQHVDDLFAALVPFVVLHELGHSTGAREHDVQGYLDEPEPPTDAENDRLKALHFGSGDTMCPMRYWHFRDGVALVQFLTGKWDPRLGAPHGGAWRFCQENWPTMRLWQRPGERMEPRPPPQ